MHTIITMFGKLKIIRKITWKITIGLRLFIMFVSYYFDLWILASIDSVIIAAEVFFLYDIKRLAIKTYSLCFEENFYHNFISFYIIIYFTLFKNIVWYILMYNILLALPYIKINKIYNLNVITLKDTLKKLMTFFLYCYGRSFFSP